MASLNLIKMKNGRAKVANKTRRRRRNTTATTLKVANRKRRSRRNPLTSASVTSYAAKNGMKLVSNKKRRRNGAIKLVANKRRRHHKRRNGIMQKANGLFGKVGLHKGTAVAVLGLLAGLGITKIESAMFSPIVAQLLSFVGLQNYATPLVQGVSAVTINKWAADAVKKGSGEYVMYGGLAMAAMSLAEIFIPSLSAYNPFAGANVTPVVFNQPQIVASGAAAALAAAQGAKMGNVRFRPVTPTMYRTPRV